MFFIMGINQGRKDLAYNQMVVCAHCGSYGRYQVFMTYTYLSLFFIPCLKWGRKYYVQTSCCNTYYELDPEIGKQLARGVEVEILPQHLQMVRSGSTKKIRYCDQCGLEREDSYEFCPKCGRKFED